MVINTTLVGTVPAGSRLVATGSFTSSTSVSLLFQLPSGTFVLWTRQGSQAPAIIPVTLPSGYSVVGSAGDYGGAAGMSQLLLRNTSGNLAYGTYAVNTASFAATSIGNPGANWSVEGNGDYNTFYNGNDQVLLQTVHNGVGTLEAYQSNLPAFTTPAGFTAVPGGTGNFFGTDLPGTLLSNAQGTVEAVLSGGTVNTGGVTTAISQVSVLGTLQGGQTIAAVGPRNSDGSTDILLQNAGTLSEWVVQSGIVQQTMVLGTLPPGASVAGLTDLGRNGTADVLLVTNTGSIETIASGLSTITASRIPNNMEPDAPEGPFYTSKPAVIVDPNYYVLTNAGINSTLSDYFAELTSGALAATGATLITIQQGALSNCSYEQVAAGNLTLAAWQQNVATLNAIAEYCRNNGIGVQIETQLGGLNSSFGTAATEQWLVPAVAAGLPIVAVEDDLECPTWETLDVNTMAAQELPNIAIINAAYPDAKLGEWDVMGDIENSGTISAYHTFLETWWETINRSATALGLPGISYVIADQYYSPELVVGTGTVSAAGQDPGQDNTYNSFDDFATDAEANGISVQIQAAASDVDLNPLQILGRAALEVSQESTLSISAIQLSAGFNSQPVSAAMNVPGSTYNCAAEIAAIEPLYQAGSITAAGPVSLTLLSQLVAPRGTIAAVGGISVILGAADQDKRLAVVLIDQTGTLSATEQGGATVTRDGPNILILDGTPASVSAELATLTLDEVVAGPDDIAVEVFGNSGLVAEGTISVLATNPNGSLTYKSSAAGATPQAWKAATAQVDNGVVVQETITWNPGDGLNSGEMIGGATIMPIVQLAVDQPLLEKGLTTSGTVASLPPTILSWHSDWQLYDPLNPEGATSVETVPVTETASTLIFDPSTGCLEQEVDTLMAVPSSAYVGLFPFSSPDQPFYFASGGFAITSYDQPNNPYWSTTLYANGAGGIIGIPSDSTMVIADGSTTLMTVGSVETIYGTINGINKVVEVRYLGGANNPYDEVDQVFNPYSATPQLWQQIETVPIPSSMTGASPLTLPSATTVIEFNTGNNPDWSNSIWTNVGGHLQTLSVAGDAEVATTFENSNWDSEAEITAAGVAQVQRGVSWIGEGRILSAYNLPTPIITGWISSGAIIGTGIAGDWVVVTGSNGETLGGAEVGAGGSWAVSPSAAFTPYSNYGITVQQFDLAGDTSPVSAPVAFSDAPLVITGPVSCQQTTDEETVTPFAHVVVADSDLGQTETITVTLSQPANGMLTNLGTGSYDSATGVYMDIGTAAGVSAALNSLAFVPTPGEVAAGQTVTTQFTISVTDTAAFRTSDTTTSVVATAVTAPIGEVILSGSSSQYIIADDDGLLYIEDTVAGRDGTQILSGVTVMVFSNGKGLFDPTGNAEDVARLYGAALNRAPDLAGLEAWTEALDEANVPLSQVATDFTTSPEFISHYGSLSNAHFINQLYENVLGRSADAEGALFWNSVLASGSSRGTVLIGFAESEEYKAATSATAGDNDTAEAYRLYQAAFNRTPDPVGLAYWSSTLATSASPTQVAESFINSAEFLADHGNLSADDFVATLYQNVLHRAPDAEGYQYWTNALQGGASQGSVLLGFSDSLENRIQTADATHNNWVSGVSEDRIPWLIEPVRKPKSIGPKRMNRLGFAGGSGP